MRVGHLTSVHPAHDVRIYVKECRTLQAAGHEVALVAPDCVAGVDASGIRLVPIHKRRSRLARMTATTWEVFRRARGLRADVLHFHDPELLPVGMLLKLCGERVVYDVHENVPQQVLSKDWIPKSLRRPISTLMDLLERGAARVLDGIVAATPQIASRFPARKTTLVQNFPLPSEFAARREGSSAPRRGLVYVGGITETRGIIEMVEAMQIIGKTAPEVRLTIAGNFFSPELHRRVAAMQGWQAVDFVGWRSREEISNLLASVAVGLVVLHPTPAYVDAYPVKLFEYMAAAVPVIASDFPLWRSIVAEAGCGLLVDPRDPAAIAAAALRILREDDAAQRMGLRGVAAVAGKFSWSSEGARLWRLCARLGGG